MVDEYLTRKGRIFEASEKICKESDRLIVPTKLVTTVEGRSRRVVDSSRETSSTLEVAEKMVPIEFDEIAKLAMKHKKVQTLMHYVNFATLEEEHKRQSSCKAIGADGITKAQYAISLESNLRTLLSNMKTFSYRPQPVRRTYIPKEGSQELRPLGIPSYEDKLVQGVMRRILEQIYEGKFCEFSYGFRRRMSCHKAIHEVNQIIMTKKVNFVVDADIKGFFDNVDHEWLMKFLEHDIEDKNFLRYIKRFLKSGVMEELKYYESDKGTPQGGLISPVLANVYLHYALDLWFEHVVKEHCSGEAQMVRYADDFVCFFQHQDEAEKFYRMLGVRLSKFNLELSVEKSRILRFGRFAKQHSADGKTETFDFLGFTHINGATRTGKYRLTHRTSQKKLKAKKQAVKAWLKENMHGKPVETIKKLNKKLVGHYAYYGVSGNFAGLQNFYRYIVEMLYKTMCRRSQRAWMNRKRFSRLLERTPVLEPKLYVNIW